MMIKTKYRKCYICNGSSTYNYYKCPICNAEYCRRCGDKNKLKCACCGI